MVRANNCIPNNHFHKKWQRWVRVRFNQPMRKVRRRTARLRKHAAIVLRPRVHCPTVRYNTKVRSGRGHTAAELKAAGIELKWARALGVSVDRRRRNRCVESVQLNVARLKLHVNSKTAHTMTIGTSSGVRKEKARVPTVAERSFDAFKALRRARNDAKYGAMRLRRKVLKTGAEQLLI